MITLDDWRDILWLYVDENFEQDKPFYFSVESYALIDLARRRDFEIKSSVDCIKELEIACKTLLKERSPKSFLPASVFQRQDSRPSYVICYIAQQVLAAELMVGGENVSANNFYLRYREVMGLENAEGIPLDYVQFEKLWKVFRKELLEIKNASASQITFREGYTRIDKYRYYPLSQSLIDKQSLNEIHNRVKNIHDLNEDQLLRVILRPAVLNKLTPRSVRKIKINYLQREIIQQITLFDGFDSGNKKREVTEKRKNLNERVAFDDFKLRQEEDYDFNEYYDVWFQPQENSTYLPSNGSKAFDALIRSSKESPFIFFYHDTERYRAVSLAEAAKENLDVRWVLLREVSLASVQSVLGIAWPETFKILENSTVPNGLVLYEIDGLPSIVNETAQPKADIQFIFSGGVCVNSITKTFLASFPPTEILFDGRELGKNEIIKVEGIDKTVGDFLDAIKTLTERRYFISYGNVETSLEISGLRDKPRPHIGFKLSDGQLEVSASVLTPLDQGMVHNIFLGPDSSGRGFFFDLRQIKNKTHLFKHLNVEEHHWVPVSFLLADRFLLTLNQFLGHSPRAKFWRHIIKSRHSLPSTALIARNIK